MCICLLSCQIVQGFNISPVIVSNHLSNQHVTAIAEDELGFIWIGTERGLNRFDSKQYHQYFYDEAAPSSLPSNVITSLFLDSKGRLWAGTEKGPCYYNPDNDCFVRIPVESGIHITSQIWEGSNGKIFFNMVEQLCALNPERNIAETVIEHFDPDQSFTNTCHKEDSGNFWSVSRHRIRYYNGKTLEIQKEILLQEACSYSKLLSNHRLALASENGLQYLDTQTGMLTEIPSKLAEHPVFRKAQTLLIHEIFDRYPLFITDLGMFWISGTDDRLAYKSNLNAFYDVPITELTCSFRDSRNNLWLGTRNNGALDVKRQGDNPFESRQQLFRSLKGLSVVSISTDSHGRIWAVTSSGHFFRGNVENGENQEFIPAGIPARHTREANDSRLMIDTRDRMWLLQNEHLYQLSIRGDEIGILCRYPEIRSNVNVLAESDDGTIWAGCSGGRELYYLPKGEKQFKSVVLEFLNELSYISAILPLRDGRLVLGFALRNPVIFNPENLQVETIPVWADDKSPDVTVDMTIDHSGKIWIGTRAIGVFRYDPSNGRIVKMSGISCPAISSIACDAEGNVWMATLDGLGRWKQSNGVIHNFTVEDGIGGSQFNFQSKAMLSDGSLIFGGTHGITSFGTDVDENFQQPPLYFEDLTVNGSVVAPGTVYKKNLSYSPPVTLNWKHDYFTISYASLDFGGLPSSRYEYRLVGFQKDWVDNGNRTEVSFSSLKPGKYTLEIRTIPSDSRRPVSSASLPLRITPAPWNSWWAWTLYLLTAAGILYSFYSYRLRMIKEHEASKRAQAEKEQEKKVNEMNMSFFNNISHEFRTPLSLIYGPVIQMEKGTATPQMLSTVKWNVARMMRLVNQLLDFGKLEQDALKLQVSEQEVIGLLRQTIGAFAFNMQEKRICLKTIGLEGEFRSYVDADKLDKILSNLLSNAIKYTPSGGTIYIGFDVLTESKGKIMRISVADDGPKIPEESLQRIFERYYQVENHHNYGTGIGLYFSRRLAELHHGSLECANLEGDGLVFTLDLPAEDIYRAEEKDEGHTQTLPMFALTDTDVTLETAQKHDKTILVVDDDPGIVNYLKMLLQPFYNVKQALRANAALEISRSDMPDLILSDVAMPDMDGYEFCQTVKEDSSLCHIPVILVTAKTTVEQQITGLRRGADAYVTKPFDPEYLTALISSQIKNRERLQGLFGKATKLEEVVNEEPSMAPQDRQFMEKFYTLMEENLSNDQLNIDQLADQLYISRSKFYYKVKALTGASPNAFFKTYKLNRAAELLRSGQYRISEVSDMTGFSTPSVFGRNFKAQFGMTPSEFIEKEQA